MKIDIQSKFVVLFAAAALIASAKSYDISVPDHAALAGNQIKAGDYTVKVEGNTAILRESNSTRKLEATGTIQASDKKFDQTTLELNAGPDGLNHIIAIELGGTKTKLTFNN